jgi:hypothetical protein
MDLTPEERERIYLEEKARHEARRRLDADAERAQWQAEERRQEEARQDTAKGWFVIVGLVVVVFVLAGIGRSCQKSGVASGPSTSPPSATQAPSQPSLDVPAAVKTFVDALAEMKTARTGDSMEHIKFALEVFSSGAVLLQRAAADSLTTEQRAQVAEMRRLLVLRQRQSFPVMRDRAGPLMSKQLWEADGTARTFGDRYSVIQFVAGDFAAHSNIQKAHEAISGMLVQLRFRQARYKWLEEDDKYSYYKIESPRDGDIAVVTTEGAITMVP